MNLIATDDFEIAGLALGHCPSCDALCVIDTVVFTDQRPAQARVIYPADLPDAIADCPVCGQMEVRRVTDG